MKRPIGLAALTVLELSPPEQVAAAAEAGYDFVGLRLLPVAGQTVPSFELPALERRLADTGLRVLDVEVFRLDAGTRVADFEPTLAIAARLKATDILAHGADPDPGRQRENLGRLCELCARYGLVVNIEPMPWVEVSTVARAMALVETTKDAAVLVDALHFYRADNSLAALAKIPRPRLRYVQFCDAHPGRPSDHQELIRQARGDRLFPGEGALDLRALLAALPGDLPLSLEIPIAAKMDPRERARKALEATQRFLR